MRRVQLDETGGKFGPSVGLYSVRFVVRLQKGLIFGTSLLLEVNSTK